MSPLLAMILGKVLDYLADHSDEIIDAIKEQFSDVKNDPEIKVALQDLGYEPNEDKLNRLNELLEAKGQDTQQLASLLVTRTIV